MPSPDTFFYTDICFSNPRKKGETEQGWCIRLMKIAIQQQGNIVRLEDREMILQFSQEYPKAKRELNLLVEKLDEAMGL